ncbi:type II toxin-antitoxin system RelE/ParE family toxin [Paludibacterium purpuratum]|uniref:type II toxin-antitoxin system RelE/ParE family toxin n=1 Tax=Paludibacterium purpuratum TaxID=1144873 RepID=UPI00106173E7|nr:type II toxin-antitoxin system RelE/ParE family toxin [Paludibacterium purpuratum]
MNPTTPSITRTEPERESSLKEHGTLTVREIRIRDATGTFRVIYVAKCADAIYVLHCFQKKTEKTGKTDLDLATRRYRDLLKELGQ